MDRDRFIDEPDYGPVKMYIYTIYEFNYGTLHGRERREKNEEALCFLILKNTEKHSCCICFVSLGNFNFSF